MSTLQPEEPVEDGHDKFSLKHSLERRRLFGYIHGEIPLDPPGEVKDSLTLTPLNVQPKPRNPDATTLPFVLYGFIPPQPDTKSPTNALVGFVKRAGAKLATPNPCHLSGIKAFIPGFLRKLGLNPLTEVLSFDDWIVSTNYSGSRKQALIALEQQQRNLTIRETLELFSDANNVKSFVKYEHYTDYKYPRGIYSRSDRMKCKMGPIFKTIEKEIFRLPYFIKKVPVRERPEYLVDTFGKWDGKCIATDYSSFECSFTQDIMEAIEFEVYKFMLPENKVLEEAMQILSGDNKVRFKNFSANVLATRMSGEMNTSLGNSITNLVVMAYLCHVNDTEFTGVVEGDDGLFKFREWERRPTAEQYAELGFKIKIEEVDNYNEASFCGLVFDQEALVNVTEPFYLLAKFGFSDKKYLHSSHRIKMQLVRAKAMSLADQYGQCPILGPFSQKILHLTRRYKIGKKIIESMSVYDKDQFLAIDTNFNFKIHTSTRVLFERLYKINVEHQKQIEEKFETLVEGYFFLNGCEELFPQSWSHFFQTYFVEGTPSLSRVTTGDSFFFNLFHRRRKRKLDEGTAEPPDWWGT